MGSALDFSRYSFPLKEDVYLRVSENFGHNGEFYAKIILIILIIGCLTDIPLLIILFGSLAMLLSRIYNLYIYIYKKVSVVQEVGFT